MPKIQSNLAKLRREGEVSVTHLAAVGGVTRQTIHAIEAGNFVPNTAVALKLARALDCSVEDLFALPSTEPRQRRLEQAVFLPGSEVPVEGQPVQLCRVDTQLVASAPTPWHPFLPAADAAIVERGARAGKAKLEVFAPETDFDHRILVAGCDPALSILGRHARLAECELVLAHRNSSQALELLKAGHTHIAGTHLRDNVPTVRKLFPKTPVAVISLAVWEQGIITATSNPKSVRSLEDFARRDIHIVNREAGSGSRALLDSQLEKAGIDSTLVQGYDSLAQGHLPAAWQVYAGMADCCIATHAAARMFGLHFIPLALERYDFVVRKQSLESPRIQNLFDILYRANFRRELEGLAGYDTRVAGDRVL